MAEEFDKAFNKTGSGSDEGQQSAADLKKERKESLAALTETFSKKNLFGKEAPNEEATQKAVLESQVEIIEVARNQVEQQQSMNMTIADIFGVIDERQKKQEQLDSDLAENEFEDQQLAKEQAAKQDELLKKTTDSTKAQQEQAVQGAERGSMIGKLGGAMAGAGIAAAGIGLALFASAKAMKEFDDVDGKAVADNVKHIMAIAPDADGKGSLLGFFAKGGTLTAVLAGLGVGLGYFGVGSAAAGAAEKFAGFSGESVKNNVLTLLSIKDELGGNLDMLTDSGGFLLAMTMLGAGLAVFGVGSAVAGAGMTAGDAISLEEKKTIDDGVEKFSSEGFADAIKRNVLTLLSIDDAVGGKGNLLGESSVFFLSMVGIAAGLAVFGAGATVAGVGQGYAEGIAYFTGSGELFAEQIKANVITLLSIDDELKGKDESFVGESSKFLLAMTGIGAGLAVFGAGATAGALGTAIANFLSKEDNFSQSIKNQVSTLLSIGDDRDDMEADARKVKNSLITISEGVSEFGSNNLKTAFDNFKSGILDFFTGGESPLEVAMKVADRADDLEKGAGGMKTLADSFRTFGRLDLDDMKIDDDFIDGLDDFTDKINDMFGQEAKEGFFFDTAAKESEFAGVIAATEIFNNYAESIERVNDAGVGLQAPNFDGLNLTMSGTTSSTQPNVVVVNQGSTATTSTSNTVITTELSDSTSQSITKPF